MICGVMIMDSNKDLVKVLESMREDISHVTPRAHIRTGKLSIENTLMIPMDKVLEIVDKYMEDARDGKDKQ